MKEKALHCSKYPIIVGNFHYFQKATAAGDILLRAILCGRAGWRYLSALLMLLLSRLLCQPMVYCSYVVMARLVEEPPKYLS